MTTIPGKRCPVCFSPARTTPAGDIVHVACDRCGRFTLSGRSAAQVARTDAGPEGTLAVPLGPEHSRERANASAWLWRNQGIAVFELVLKELSHVVAPGVGERAIELLRWIARASDHIGNEVELTRAHWLSISWSKNVDELRGLLNYLQDQGWVTLGEILGLDAATLTAVGWMKVESMGHGDPSSTQGFVAMAFSESMQPAYIAALAPAIEDAGYRPHRVDQHEHTGKIDDEIIAQIRRSRFVVADFSLHRAGVYYEAGFAKGLGLEVFFTCRKEDLASLHFDVRQYNTIDWQTPEELRERLAKRIEAVLGRGPVRPRAGVPE